MDITIDMNFKQGLITVLIRTEIFTLIIYCNSLSSDGDDFNATADAEMILKAPEGPERNKVFLDLLPKRTFKQCDQIHKEFIKLNNWQPLIENAYQYVTIAFKEDGYLKDLLCAKIYGPDIIKVADLKYYFDLPYPNINYEGKLLMEILILEDKNQPVLIDTYNHYNGKSFQECLKLLADDYLNFINELLNRKREEENGQPNPDEVEEAVRILNDERKNKGWNDHRQQLDTVLMNKPKNFAIEVINKYAERNHGNLLRDDIKKKINDDNLIFGYRSLIDHIIDSNAYMATRIHDAFKDSCDKQTTSILIIVGNSENGLLPKINDAFQKQYGKSINDFLMEKDDENIVNQILAAIVVHSVKDETPDPSADQLNTV